MQESTRTGEKETLRNPTLTPHPSFNGQLVKSKDSEWTINKLFQQLGNASCLSSTTWLSAGSRDILHKGAYNILARYRLRKVLRNNCVSPEEFAGISSCQAHKLSRGSWLLNNLSVPLRDGSSCSLDILWWNDITTYKHCESLTSIRSKYSF